MDPSSTLAAAGIGVVARVPVAAGGHAPGAFEVLFRHWSHVWTSRIPEVRAADAIAAWLREQQTTLGPPPAYYLRDDSGPTPAWLCIETADPGWLARIWPPLTDELLVLSGDGTRCLLVITMVGVANIHAVACTTSDVLAMHAEHNQLFEILDHPEVLRVSYPPAPRRVRTDDVFRAPPLTTLSAFAGDERRDAWVTDAFHRWRLQTDKLDDAWLGDQLGPYDLSLARSPYLVTLQAWALAPTAIAAIWRRAGRDRLVVLDAERTRALALSCTGDAFEARVTELDDLMP